MKIRVTSVTKAKKLYGAVFDWRFQDYGPDYASSFDGRLSGGFTTVQTVKEGGPLVIIYSTDVEETKRRLSRLREGLSKRLSNFLAGIDSISPIPVEMNLLCGRTDTRVDGRVRTGMTPR